MRFNSKSYIDTLLLVHFEGCKCYFVPLYLCTEGRGRIEGRNGDGRTEGRRAAGGQAGGDTPPLMIYVGTIRGFGMQKFFFEFGVPWFCGLNGVNGLNGQEFDVSCWP